MTDTTMKELFAKFQHFWRSGKDAHLSLECHAGQAWLNLRVHLPHQPHQRPQQRKPGPSRLRRRERRAQARAAAVNAAAENPEVAEGATEIAVQVSPPFPVAHDTHAEKAVDDHDNPPEVEQLDVEVVTTETTKRPVQLNVDAKPWLYSHCDVQDVFCPDQQYRQQSNQPLPHSPPNQCNDCGKTFGSTRALTNHVKQNHTLQSNLI